MDTPSGWDPDVALACTFLVDVAASMCVQWCKDGSPAPGDFTWTPGDYCSVTVPGNSLDDFDLMPEPIWSTFTPTLLRASHTEPFAIAAVRGNVGYLAFRGSQTLADLVMDGETSQVGYTAPTSSPPSGMCVERGFYAVYQGIGETTAALASRLDGAGTIVVTGHSLGSALATLTVPSLLSLGVPLLHYNQASPMVGNQAFADYYDGLGVPTYRLVNTCDVVPTLPHGSYAHVGTEVAFTADYGNEPDDHDPCCCYSYALVNPGDPVNPNMGTCVDWHQGG